MTVRTEMTIKDLAFMRKNNHKIDVGREKLKHTRLKQFNQKQAGQRNQENQTNRNDQNTR